MIKLNKIIPQTVQAFDPSGNFLGDCNEYELNDLRIQIRKEKVSGYYVLFGEQKLHIGSNGRFEHWPDGFFSLFTDQLSELIGTW